MPADLLAKKGHGQRGDQQRRGHEDGVRVRQRETTDGVNEEVQRHDLQQAAQQMQRQRFGTRSRQRPNTAGREQQKGREAAPRMNVTCMAGYVSASRFMQTSMTAKVATAASMQRIPRALEDCIAVLAYGNAC